MDLIDDAVLAQTDVAASLLGSPDALVLSKPSRSPGRRRRRAPKPVHWPTPPRDRAMEFLFGLNRLYLRFWCRWSSNGPAPLPQAGPVIVLANHLSPLDPLILQRATSRKIAYIIAREYYDTFGLRWLYRHLGCVPVNRDGKDVGGMKAALRFLRQGGVLGVFPEGRMHLERPGELLPGRLGAALLALRSRAPVVPALISGAPLGHTMIRPFFQRCRVRVDFGPAIDLRAYYDRPPDRETLREVTDLFMSELGRLADLRRGKAGR